MSLVSKILSRFKITLFQIHLKTIFQAVNVTWMDPLTMFVMLMMENVLVKIILMDIIVTRVQKAGGISQILRVRAIFQILDTD